MRSARANFEKTIIDGWSAVNISLLRVAGLLGRAVCFQLIYAAAEQLVDDMREVPLVTDECGVVDLGYFGVLSSSLVPFSLHHWVQARLQNFEPSSLAPPRSPGDGEPV